MPFTGQTHVLTGAFGYSGAYLRDLLLEKNAKVITFTNRPPNNPEAAKNIEIHPFNFKNLKKMAEIMSQADVFYNNYWVRFNHKNFQHQKAVKNIKILFEAAKEAQVKKIVHISITNPSLNSPFEYFQGKAVVEEALKNLGLAYSILRPSVLFGGNDILINNIAWALRKLFVFGVFGCGNYKLRPIHVQDLANLMLQEGQNKNNSTINAVGPERYTYRQLVKMLNQTMGLNRLIIPFPAWPAYLVGTVIGKLKKDVFITWPEVQGLQAGLLDTPESFQNAPGKALLSTWAEKHALSLGRYYASELARR